MLTRRRIDAQPEWTEEEQRRLEQGLREYSCDEGSNIFRYAKLARQVGSRSLREVALRVYWMNQIERELKEDVHRQKGAAEDIFKGQGLNGSTPEGCDDALETLTQNYGQFAADHLQRSMSEGSYAGNSPLLNQLSYNVSGIQSSAASLDTSLEEMPSMPVQVADDGMLI